MTRTRVPTRRHAPEPRHGPKRPHVLLLRPREAAERTAGRLEALGWTASMSPLLEIDAGDPPPAMEGIVGWTVTSGHALDRIAPETFERLRMRAAGCVGVRTFDRLRERGCEPACRADDARSLAREIAAALRSGDWPPGPLLDIGAPQRAFDLSKALPDRIEHRRWVNYIAHARRLSAQARRMLDGNAIDAVWLTSPRIAHGFAADIVAPGDVALVAISEAVANALPAPWRDRVHVATTPDHDGLVQATREAVARRPGTVDEGGN